MIPRQDTKESSGLNVQYGIGTRRLWSTSSSWDESQSALLRHEAWVVEKQFETSRLERLLGLSYENFAGELLPHSACSQNEKSLNEYDVSYATSRSQESE